MSAARKKKTIQRKVRPRILIALKSPLPFVDTLIDIAREWEWDLLDYKLLHNAYPKDIPPSGAIVSLLPDDPLVKHLQSIQCPTVRLGVTFHPLDHRLPAVLADLEATGRLAAFHFLERGFSNAAFIGWDPSSNMNPLHLLYTAYRKTLEEAGVQTCHYSLAHQHKGDESPEERVVRLQDELGGWLSQLPKPIGVMGYKDRIMAQLCTYFQLRGGHVPEEIALLGYGNSSWCNRSPVPLSSIAPGFQERARRAMHLLRGLMEGKPAPDHPILVPPAGLIKRRSTDILAMSDVLVAQALVFIWEHIQENISVADVAHSVNLSERQLGRRFYQAIGRSVNQEIVRRRIENVKNLLRSSDGSISEIATATGYRSARYLHFAFQKAVGMTPGEYRKSHAR